jgi:magnesium transporter
MMTEGIWWPHAYSALVIVLVIVGYITYRLVNQIASSDAGRRR